LERVGTDWILVDGGLSRNGTFVNGERLLGRRRLEDCDVILVGSASLSLSA
jgi:pSer/pThr/pTyr-binding forkhead associated (FHA) protein